MVAVLLALAILSGFPAALQSQESAEYEVKAAFLFHFAQFVEWPPEVFQDAGSPLTYCTIGDDPFRGALEESLKGKTVGGRPLLVQHLKTREQIPGCQIVFIGSGEKKHLEEDVARAAGRPILTVGETEHFAQDGGIIGLLVENNKVRFEINLPAADNAKLKISSRLLQLAKTIIGSYGNRR